MRLAMAMFIAVAASLLIISGTQRIAEFRAYQALPDSVKEVVPAPRLLPLWEKARGGPRPGPGPEHGQAPVDDRFAQSFLASRNYQRESLVIGALLASLLTIALAWWLSRLIARPLEEVSKAATLVASGDLAVRVPVDRAMGRSSLETQRLAEDFNRMAEALEGYESERKAMIADIAHELRTPLTAMRLRLQALEDGLLPFEPQEIASLNRSAELLSRLIEDLRTLSLAEGGRLRLSLKEYDLGQVVAAAVNLQRPGFDQKGVDLVMDSDGLSQPVPTTLDRDRITQVLGNLLDNALRVTAAGGSVTVAVTAAGSDRLITISDTGPGLSQASLDRAFDRYFQDDRDTRGGSGLGLAIVDALVKLHGGSVTATNYASGARFTVRLPQGAASSASMSA